MNDNRHERRALAVRQADTRLAGCNLALPIVEASRGAANGFTELLDGLAALAELFQALLPKLELDCGISSRHLAVLLAIYTGYLQLRNKPTPRLTTRPPKNLQLPCTLTAKLEKLEAKLQQKNEVIAELLQEHVELKKELGDP